MSEADKTWLAEAMAEMTVDEAKRMEEIVDTLDAARKGTRPCENVSEMFEELQDIVEQIDQAHNLHKIGKLAVLIEMLRDANPVFKAHAAEIIATAAQNNPKVQEVAIQGGALAYATHVFVHDDDATVRVKALLCISCLIRNYPPGEMQLAEGDGIYVLCRGITDADPRVAIKSIHLLGYLLTRDPALRVDQVIAVYGHKVQETGICNKLVEMMSEGGAGSIDLAEGVLQLLVRIANIAGPRSVILEAGVRERAAERVAVLKGLEDPEEIEGAQTQVDLLELLSKLE